MSSRNVNCELERSPVGMGIRKVSQWILYSDFTDGGSTAGTKNMAATIPAGSFVIGSKVTVITGFTGNTTCTLGVGVSGTAGAFSGNSTHNIYTAASNLVKAAFISTDCGLVAEGSATTVLLTATGTSDFTSITAGKMLVEVYYLSTNVELNDTYVNKYNI